MTYGFTIDDGSAFKCPYCGEYPRLLEFEDNFYSRKRHVPGWRFTDYVIHSCNGKENFKEKGKPVEIFAHVNGGVSETLWNSEEIMKAREKAEENAVKKWNSLVRKELKTASKRSK